MKFKALVICCYCSQYEKYKRFDDIDECYKFLDCSLYDIAWITIDGKECDFGDMYWWDKLEELRELLE